MGGWARPIASPGALTDLRAPGDAARVQNRRLATRRRSRARRSCRRCGGVLGSRPTSARTTSPAGLVAGRGGRASGPAAARLDLKGAEEGAEESRDGRRTLSRALATRARSPRKRTRPVTRLLARRPAPADPRRMRDVHRDDAGDGPHSQNRCNSRRRPLTGHRAGVGAIRTPLTLRGF